MSPTSRVGKKERKINFKPKIFLLRVLKYKPITAKIAPDWIATSNTFKKSFSAMPKNFAVQIRWKVEETGKNSVIPSVRPKTTAIK